MQSKVFKSPEYNFLFNSETGFFARWGKDFEDDPEFSPFGPEILDIEISTACSKECPWCYKSNTSCGKHMSFESFKVMFDKFPKHLTQIAFGIGDIDGNPDMWKIMDYCRENDVVPNVTINGERMTNDLYDRLASTCGAVAVSLYDKETCFNAVAELTKRGMEQVNIHALLSKETYMNCYTTCLDRITDPRLEKLNAIVFLWLKPKGDRNQLHQLDSCGKFRDLIETALEVGGAFGFDSCTAANFIKILESVKPLGKPLSPEVLEQYRTMSEPCESTLFSYYINVDGIGFPCSFSEGNGIQSDQEPVEFSGVDVLGCDDFMKDIWNAEETKGFRARVMGNKDCNGCRMCPLYDLELK